MAKWYTYSISLDLCVSKSDLLFLEMSVLDSFGVYNTGSILLPQSARFRKDVAFLYQRLDMLSI